MKKLFTNFFTISALAASLLSMTGCAAEGTHSSHGVNMMEEAELLAIYERDGFDEVYIVNHDGKEVAHYALIESGDTVSYSLPEDAIEIRIPLSKASIDSEVYAAAFEELGSAEKIAGMFDAPFVTSPSLRREIDSGQISDLGQPSSPDLEKIIALAPDAIIVSYFDGMQTGNLERLNFPILKMYDLQERKPLGRAEWIRLLGRLTGNAEEADSIFYAVKKNYEEIASSVTTRDSLPKVLTETVYEGTWYVPGGASYQAALIRDAGGNYFKAGDGNPVTLNLTAEQVLHDGGDSDIWIIRHYGDEEDLKSILASDPVYRDIKAFQQGNVYFSDTSRSSLFREFPFHPERLLRDYRIIFSNDTSFSPTYFHRLTPAPVKNK